MQRARRSMLSLLVVGVALLGMIGAAPFSSPSFLSAAAVGWPVSGGVLVAEVVTGGASASDEYIEIVNSGSTPVDLQNVELVYVSAAGTSPTRKAAWISARPLAPGQHLLVANAAGVFAASADATYVNGIAATGGSVALRAIGGAVLDSVGWGDATNAFVEGMPALAPPASSSMERRPGGGAGNRADTNDNRTDFLVQAHPEPQNLAAPFDIPQPSPSPAPSATAPETPPPTPGGTPAASGTPAPTGSDTPQPSPSAPGPTDSPAPTQSPGPTDTPTATEAPTPTGTPPATDPPSPTETPTTTQTPGPTEVPAPTETPAWTPGPTDTPAPVETPPATPEATPVVTDGPPAPTGTPNPTETPAPTDPPAPSQTPAPTPSATPDPATPAPTAEPVTVSSIAAARAAGDGARVTVEGVLTTDLGAFDGGRGAVIQDASGGIALYLDAPAVTALPRSARVRVSGTLDQRYSMAILRVAESDVVDLGQGTFPLAVEIGTGDAGEALEGRRVTVEGPLVGSPSTVADGTSLTIDDGSGPVRIIVGTPPAGLTSGVIILATGPLGQRDSSGTGNAGYRLFALDSRDVMVRLPPPSPTASPGPTDVPSPSPTTAPSGSPAPSATPAPPSPTGSPAPTATPSPTPSPVPSEPPVIEISAARALPTGVRAHVRGTITAEVGRVGSSLVSIQDASGGLAVHLPAGAMPPAPGDVVDVIGDLAAPYGQLEIRPRSATWRIVGGTDVPPPVELAGALDESLEGLLVAVEGTVVASPATGGRGDVSMALELAGGTRLRVQAAGTSGVTASMLVRQSRYRLVGIVGQRASAIGRLDGYRIWLRDAADIVAIQDPAPSTSPSLSPSPSSTASATPSPSPVGPPVVSIVTAILSGGSAAVEGVVTASPGLLDGAGRAIVIQDDTAAILVRLPSQAPAVRTGHRLRVVGASGRSYGAPRILASVVTDLGLDQGPKPVVLRRQPTAAVEWRLVQVSGQVAAVHRDGRAWNAEVVVGGASVLVKALAGAGIPPARCVPERPSRSSGSRVGRFPVRVTGGSRSCSGWERISCHPQRPPTPAAEPGAPRRSRAGQPRTDRAPRRPQNPAA